MHFIQRKQFSETNVTSRALQQILYFKIFPECFRGPLMELYGLHAASRPVVEPHWTGLQLVALIENIQLNI